MSQEEKMIKCSAKEHGYSCFQTVYVECKVLFCQLEKIFYWEKKYENR